MWMRIWRIQFRWYFNLVGMLKCIPVVTEHHEMTGRSTWQHTMYADTPNRIHWIPSLFLYTLNRHTPYTLTCLRVDNNGVRFVFLFFCFFVVLVGTPRYITHIRCSFDACLTKTINAAANAQKPTTKYINLIDKNEMKWKHNKRHSIDQKHLKKLFPSNQSGGAAPIRSKRNKRIGFCCEKKFYAVQLNWPLKMVHFKTEYD